ncbi:MAG: proprotein convertase P-domain-containing protein, partial [Pirellulales bacterium]|nr:proprotein convertase P-domain-containing protein [Pirellulales bacterium]
MRRLRLLEYVGVRFAGKDSLARIIYRKGLLFSGATEVAPRRTRGGLKLEPLEARMLLAVTPLGGGECDAPKPIGWDAAVQPLGFDEDVPVDLVDQYLGFDGDTSIYSTTDGEGATGDATPTGTSYLLWENWGGMWQDAEKTPSDTEDDLHCWAAAASNVLAWTGWGLVDGMTNCDEMFQYFQDHWTDEGGMMEYGWDWWFDGTNNSQGWSGWAQEDVEGGNFYPGENAYNYIHSQSSDSLAMSAINEYLHAGYGTTIGIFGPGGHAITVWGYNYDPSNPSDYLGIWVTDSDDYKYMENAPDRLRYYEVEYIGSQWFLQDYYGSDEWYIGVVQALEQKEPGDPPAPDPVNEISGTVWNDLNGDGSQDVGETGLAGETVYLDLNENGTLDTQTLNIDSADIPKNILDHATTISTITFGGFSQPITDVNITLDITHTYTADLQAYLISAEGTRVLLFSGVGGSGNDFSNTTFDNAAGTSISDGSAPFTGTFRPQGDLGALFGESVNGTWQLEITDGYTADQGTLNSWSLEITLGETCATTDANGAFVFTGLEDGDYRVRSVAPDGWAQTAPGDGYYDVTLFGGETVDTANFGFQEFSATYLGVVDYCLLEDVSLSAGEYWYSFRTTHDGYLSVEAVLANPSDIDVSLYNSNHNQVAASAVSPNGQRVDYVVQAGELYYFRAVVSAPQTVTDLKVANLVERSGDTVTVYGSNGDDDFIYAVDALTNDVTINGLLYCFGRGDVTTVTFDGGNGSDTATLTGSDGNDTFTLRPGQATAVGSNYTVSVTNVTLVTARGGGGTDIAYLYDSAGDDTFLGRSDFSVLSGNGLTSWVEDFRCVYAYATAGGTDTAKLYDSAGDDTFIGRDTAAALFGANFCNQATGFQDVKAYATRGGSDTAKLYDSAGDDLFTADDASATLSGAGFSNYAEEFGHVYAYATGGGTDTAKLYDSAGDDTFVGRETASVLYGATFYNYAAGFRSVYAYATGGGTDTAKLYDSAGDDTFIGRET